MIQMFHAAEFFRSLKEDERIELCKAIAEDIFFLEEELQEEILELLHEAEPEISAEIRKINSFTRR